MKLLGEYRHENKYQISIADYLALRSRLQTVMMRDPHVRSDGTYRIRSVYFDNYRDKALREKVDGVAKREKYRIRWYNEDLSFITLEKKIKYNNLCRKLDETITREEFERILKGDTVWLRSRCAMYSENSAWQCRNSERTAIAMNDSFGNSGKPCNSDHPLLRELTDCMVTQQLRPRVLVSYLREPYIYGPGNVRVTFDSDIRTSLFQNIESVEALSNLLETSTAAAETTDEQIIRERILEVKFDAYLPSVIADLLQMGNLRQGAFSKYGACRRFG